MKWPHEWTTIDIDGYLIHAAPHEYVHGLLQIVTQWQDEEQKNLAFNYLGQLMVEKVLEEKAYVERVEGVAVATVYASLGLASPDACQWCIDTLEALVP